MKLRFLGQANSNYPNQKKTLGSEYNVLFQGQSDSLYRSFFLFILRLLAFSRLAIRILLNGYRPKIRQIRDREQNIDWYAYYPLSGVSKFLASEAEIKQLLSYREDFIQ